MDLAVRNSEEDDIQWEWCWGKEQAGTVLDNKLYIIGGFISEAPTTDDKKSSRNYFANPHIRIIDFSKSQVSLSQVYSSGHVRLPLETIPVLKFFSFWTLPTKTLLLSQGELQYYPLVDPDDTTKTLPLTRIPPRGNTYEFSPITQEWTTNPPDPDVPNSIVRGASAFSNKAGKGFVLGGELWGNSYEDENRELVEVDKDFKPVSLRGMLEYEKGGWKNETTPLEHIDFATLSAIDGAGEEGLLVVIGGSRDGAREKDWRSLRTVQVYDIASRRWYNQETSASGGFFPSDRVQHCAVVASAPDGSSHNIYIYGGLSPEKKAVLDDIWVLSLPSFHWIKIASDTGPPARSAMSCNIVGKEGRYMFVFGGDKGGDFEQECDEGGPGNLFDLKNAVWTDTFTSGNGLEAYGVPGPVWEAVGGTAEGGATFLEPRGGWADESLAALFTIKQVDKSNTTNAPEPDPSSSSAPTTLPTEPAPGTSAPLAPSKLSPGVIAGITLGSIAVLLLASLLLLLLHRRRHPRSIPEREGLTTPSAELDDNRTSSGYLSPPSTQFGDISKLDVTTMTTPTQVGTPVLSPVSSMRAMGGAIPRVESPPVEIGRMKSVYEKDGVPVGELVGDTSKREKI